MHWQHWNLKAGDAVRACGIVMRVVGVKPDGAIGLDVTGAGWDGAFFEVLAGKSRIITRDLVVHNERWAAARECLEAGNSMVRLVGIGGDGRAVKLAADSVRMG